MRLLLVTAAAVFLAALGVALAGTGARGGGSPAAGRVAVVATTTQVADLARAVAHGRARVTGLLAPNADPHGYEVRPGDVRALADARLVVRSGGEVDGWLTGPVRAAGAAGHVVDLSRFVRLRGDDPHWWQDPRNGARAVEALEAALARADPAGAGVYARNADRYAASLRRLDAQIATCWSAVPPARRRLVTTHDAYGYYARRYGLTLAGAVIPSLSTRAQASPRALAQLARTIRREHIGAVFTERALNPGVERAVAREGGAAIGRPLTGDALGPRGSASGTYLGALAADTHALVDGLAGRHVACRLDGRP